jgi:hypothetical protein
MPSKRRAFAGSTETTLPGFSDWVDKRNERAVALPARHLPELITGQ